VTSYLLEQQNTGDIVTGLLYLNETVPDMHELNRTPKTALTKLLYEALCPGAAALEQLQAEFR
jgi:2-oxoglutarate ferredoxin oxidoreductase subunit beta